MDDHKPVLVEEVAPIDLEIEDLEDVIAPGIMMGD
jgi:hypothetical protein